MYRVWIHIEELGEDGESGGEPVAPQELAEFSSLDEAEGYADRLLERGGEVQPLQKDRNES